jgi:hypothetical protein
LYNFQHLIYPFLLQGLGYNFFKTVNIKGEIFPHKKNQTCKETNQQTK